MAAVVLRAMLGVVRCEAAEVLDPAVVRLPRFVLEQQQIDVPFLGRIPLDIAIRTASDAGKPVAGGDDLRARAFDTIAERLEAWMAS